MKKIKVLGNCCSKCQQAITVIEETVRTHGLDIKLEKVEEMSEIMKYDILSTPGIVVGDEVKMVGKVPTTSEILELIDDE